MVNINSSRIAQSLCVISGVVALKDATPKEDASLLEVEHHHHWGHAAGDLVAAGFEGDYADHHHGFWGGAARVAEVGTDIDAIHQIASFGQLNEKADDAAATASTSFLQLKHHHHHGHRYHRNHPHWGEAVGDGIAAGVADDYARHHRHDWTGGAARVGEAAFIIDGTRAIWH